MRNFEDNLLRHFNSSAPDLLNNIKAHPVVMINSDEELFSELKKTRGKSEKVNNSGFKWYGFAAAVAMIIVCFTVLLKFNVSKVDIVGNIIIDCNPSFNLEITDELNVSSVIALNDDGAQIIEKIDENKTIESVVYQIVDELKNYGYLDINSDKLLVSYCFKNDNSKFEEIKSMIDKNIADTKISIIYQSFKEEQALYEKASENNVSVGKYKFVEKMSDDHKYNKEKLLKMNINRIVDEVCKEVDFKDIDFNEDYSTEIDNKDVQKVSENKRNDISDTLNNKTAEIKATEPRKDNNHSPNTKNNNSVSGRENSIRNNSTVSGKENAGEQNNKSDNGKVNASEDKHDNSSNSVNNEVRNPQGTNANKNENNTINNSANKSDKGNTSDKRNEKPIPDKNKPSLKVDSDKPENSHKPEFSKKNDAHKNGNKENSASPPKTVDNRNNSDKRI